MKKFETVWKKVIDTCELVQVRDVEMQPLYERCFEFKEPLIIEIGSAHGASSIVFAEAARQLDGQVICIDYFPKGYYGQAKFGDYAREAFYKNTAEYSRYLRHVDMPSNMAMTALQNEFATINIIEANILFVDGDHSYEGVVEDCRNYLPVLEKGGYVGFHDYNNPHFDVRQGVDEFRSRLEEVGSYWDLRLFRKL